MSATSNSELQSSNSSQPDDNPGRGVGLSNTHLSKERRQMLDLVNRLHSTGVQVDIDLPQIAVIGSQSAGKSSLIESISGITLPRASGTCTRCPTECRLSHSVNPWKCIVSLRRMKNGQAHNEQFGNPILEGDKAQVEERIRRAQRAILNPSKSSERYLKGEDEESTEPELTFSRDCVSLQISGPNVSDLSFCDLPGLIAGVGRGGDKSDIALVESLAVSYIKKPSCIILLTVACETDFQNQGAHELARAYDPEGKRTIGVLTKPDRIPVGEEPGWMEFIRNEKEPLENNWYCVKQLDSQDLKSGMTWMDARRAEEQFFLSKAPWCDLEEMYKKYLGTTNLVYRLSSILANLISKRIPEIQDELEKSILSVREALNKLPKEPSKDPQNEISTMLHGFVTDLAKRVEGVPDQDGLLQSIRPAHEKFRRAVRSTAPQFQPFEKRYAKTKAIERAKFLENEEGHEDLDNGDEESEGEGKYGGFIYIDEVMEYARRARTRELPGNYPFVVQQTFINAIIKQWNGPAQILCKTVYSILIEHMKKLVAEHFASFGQGGLEHRVKIILQDHMKKCFEQTEERVNWLLQLENQPFSLNTHYLTDYKDKFLSHYRGAREADRNVDLTRAIKEYTPPINNSNYSRSSMAQSPTGIAKVLAGLVEIGIIGIKPEDLAKLIQPDGMEPALIIMADIRAYFQVAYKRFADNIPLAIDHELVRGVERKALQILYAGLGINGPEGHRICKELAQESPSVAGRREELLRKMERMEIASQELLHIGI